MVPANWPPASFARARVIAPPPVTTAANNTAAMAMAITNSIKVNPRWARSGAAAITVSLLLRRRGVLTGDVRVFPIAARRSVPSVGADHRLPPLVQIHVLALPGVHRHLRKLLRVDQRLEPGRGVGIPPLLRVVELKRALDSLDVQPGDV